MIPAARTRADIERDIKIAEDAVGEAQRDMERAEYELAEFEAELAELPPEDADEELWYARRDRRQLWLALER